MYSTSEHRQYHKRLTKELQTHSPSTTCIKRLQRTRHKSYYRATQPELASLSNAVRCSHWWCCRHRPDLMHSSEGADDGLSAKPQPQAPLVLCSVAGPARDALIGKLMQEYPAKFGSAVRYLAESVWRPTCAVCCKVHITKPP